MKTKRTVIVANGLIFLIRILVALFSMAGAIGWTVMFARLWQWGKSSAGAGDGAGGSSESQLMNIMILGIFWLLPVLFFCFVFFQSLVIGKQRK